MKQFIVAIFLCVAFSSFVNAAQRKIAYERGEKIFVADVDGTHSKKVADGALPEISPDGTRIALDGKIRSCSRNTRERRAQARRRTYSICSAVMLSEAKHLWPVSFARI
jgi:hypothetical protein